MVDRVANQSPTACDETVGRKSCLCHSLKVVVCLIGWQSELGIHDLVYQASEVGLRDLLLILAIGINSTADLI